MHRAIGNGDAESDFNAVAGLASELGYDQAEFNRAIEEAAEAYQADHERALIETTFGDMPEAPVGVS